MALKTNNLEYMYTTTYSPEFDILGFNKWLFNHFFTNIEKFDRNKIADIVIRLAEVEKGFNIGATLEVIFLANMLQIAKLLQPVYSDWTGPK
jgi:hypothetical protein